MKYTGSLWTLWRLLFGLRAIQLTWQASNMIKPLCIRTTCSFPWENMAANICQYAFLTLTHKQNGHQKMRLPTSFIYKNHSLFVHIPRYPHISTKRQNMDRPLCTAPPPPQPRASGAAPRPNGHLLRAADRRSVNPQLRPFKIDYLRAQGPSKTFFYTLGFRFWPQIYL